MNSISRSNWGPSLPFPRASARGPIEATRFTCDNDSSTMLHRVKDLSPEQRVAVESLLGHPVSEDEAVSIKSLRPAGIIPSKLSPDQRVQAFEELNAFFASAQVESPNVSEEEEESIVNEAMRTTRPNYRPID